MEIMKLIPVFIKAAECGSFAKAGIALGISPSSVSRQIDKLEGGLAAKLFKRSTRSLSLTPAGKLLLDKAKSAFIDIESVCAEVSSTSIGEPRGELKISILESFGRIRVCPLLPRFLTRFPHVKIEVVLDNSVADLYQDDIDLAIRIGVPQDSRLKARKLISNRMVLCASPAYILEKGMPARPEDVSDHNCLVLKRTGPTTWWYFYRDDRCHKVRASGNLISIGGTPLIEAALQGLGLVLVAEWMVAEALSNGELVRVLSDWQPELSEDGSGEVYAVFLNNAHMNPTLRALIDYLVVHISKLSTYK